jgi:molybdopterin converting factor subunit 1
VKKAGIFVNVRFFASVKDMTGLSEASVELPATSIADDVVAHFVSKFPAMAELRPYLRIAVNESYVDVSHTLRNGDEVALIPPVSGG